MALTLSLFAGAGAQFFDNNGNVLSGGKIYTYQAGTTTPLAVYTSNNESAFHTNPIILDAAGRVPSGGEIWLQFGVGYKFVLRTSTDVLIATYDNIPSSAQQPAANDADSILYEQGYTVTAGSFVVGKIYRITSVGTTDFTLIGATNNTVGTHFIATGVGTGTGTAELSQTVETKLRETVSVKDFGAVGDGVTDDTAAFVAAIGTGTVNVFVPAGTYKVSTVDLKNRTTLFGDGIASIIQSDGSSNHVLTGQYVYHVTIKNLYVRGVDARTNLCGIYMNGAVWTILEDLFVFNNGSHGIQFTDTGTAYSGSYPVMVKGVHCLGNSGDGFRQVATSGTNQQNAIEIIQSEFQLNGGNGLTLWGFGISVTQTVSEGNTGFGVYLNNGLSSGIYSAARISIKDCYFELNTAGHIAARVGTYGAILGLTVADNIYNTNGTLLGAGFKEFSVTNVGSTANSIRDLDYRGNISIISGTDPTVYADFAGAPNNASRIEPYFSSISPTDITTIPAKYTNLGYATFKYVDSLVLNGYWFAKGGSGITYSGRTKSDSITASASNTYFPIQVPLGSQLAFIAVPVETDTASYTVSVNISARSYDSFATPANIASQAIAGTGNQFIRTAFIPTLASGLVTTTRAELLLELVVTWTTPGTYFYFGSPTVYYVAP